MKLRDNTRALVARQALVAALCAGQLLFNVSCGQRQPPAANQPAQAQPPVKVEATPPKVEVKSYQGTGVVTKIVLENPYDKTLASVELDHQEIVGLMPAMKMEFYVKERSLLKNLKVGDKVDFTIEDTGGAERISDITKKK